MFPRSNHLPPRSVARFLGLLSFVGIVGWQLATAADAKVGSAPSVEVAPAIPAEKIYEILVVSPDDFADSAGRHFSAKRVKSYLKKNPPDADGAYIFWVLNRGFLAVAHETSEVFRTYGVTDITIKDATAAPPPAPAEIEPKTAARPVNLQPGKTPPRVRYVLKSDDEVLTTAKHLELLFLTDEPPPPNFAFSPRAKPKLMAGLWTHLAQIPELTDTKKLVGKISSGQAVTQLEVHVISTAAQFDSAIAQIRQLIASDGGGNVRALTTKEMDHWWTFISFDIVEPTLVIASHGGKYRFVISWSGDHIAALDELNALPPPAPN